MAVDTLIYLLFQAEVRLKPMYIMCRKLALKPTVLSEIYLDAPRKRNEHIWNSSTLLIMNIHKVRVKLSAKVSFLYNDISL